MKAKGYKINYCNLEVLPIGKYMRGNIFEVFEIILKIAGLIVSAIGTVVKAIDLIDKFRHQKSNRRTPK